MQRAYRTLMFVCGGLVLVAGAAVAQDATSFVEPEDWTVGDVSTTYQEWDVLSASTGNTPDVGYTVNPVISADPVLDILSPGFASSSGNTYSYMGDYGVETTVYNHGGTYGVGGYAASDGTYVIVQYAATQNPDYEYGVDPNSIALLDLEGAVLAGGANAEILNREVLFQGWVSGPYGDVLQEEVLVEFYLSGHTGDFKLATDLVIHAGLRQLRIDTAIVAGTVLGDLDGDGDVDLADLQILLANYGQVDVGYEQGDLDGDGDVDLSDLQALLSNYGYVG